MHNNNNNKYESDHIVRRFTRTSEYIHSLYMVGLNSGMISNSYTLCNYSYNLT